MIRIIVVPWQLVTYRKGLSKRWRARQGEGGPEAWLLVGVGSFLPWASGGQGQSQLGIGRSRGLGGRSRICLVLISGKPGGGGTALMLASRGNPSQPGRLKTRCLGTSSTLGIRSSVWATGANGSAIGLRPRRSGIVSRIRRLRG
jgi:hypothetical protein